MTDIPDDETLARYFQNPQDMLEEDRDLMMETLINFYTTPSQVYNCKFCNYSMILRKGYSVSCTGCAVENKITKVEWL